MGQYDWSDLQRDTSVPRLPTGEVDLKEAGLRVLQPARQISQNNIALLRLLQAKCRNPSAWSYVTSASTGFEIDVGVGVGGQSDSLLLERRKADERERVDLTIETGQIGIGLGLSAKSNGWWKVLKSLLNGQSQSTDSDASAGVLLLGEGRADFAAPDFAGLTIGLTFSGGALAGTYASALLFDVDEGLHDAFRRVRDAIDALSAEQPGLLDFVVPAVGAYHASMKLGRFISSVHAAQERFARDGARGVLLFAGDQAMGFSVGFSVVLGSVSVTPIPVFG